MYKTFIFSLFVLFITVLPAKADMKYTELQTTKMTGPFMNAMPNDMPENFNSEMQDMSEFQNMMPPNMQNMMANIMQPPPNKTVFFIKASKKRVDKPSENQSTIYDCTQKKIIAINHKHRTYEILDMQKKIDQKDKICPAHNENQNLNLPITDSNNNGQLIFKMKITDTKEEKFIGSLKARHYIQETTIYGNPSCMPDMKNIEHLWVADFKAEEFYCPTTEKYKYCPQIPKDIPQNTCVRNAKFIREGITDIPGFVVKREFEMSMNNIPEISTIKPNKYQTINSNPFKISNIVEITEISTSPIPDSLFLPPSGYTEIPPKNNSYDSVDF